jgi:hypothetical protein
VHVYLFDALEALDRSVIEGTDDLERSTVIAQFEQSLQWCNVYRGHTCIGSDQQQATASVASYLGKRNELLGHFGTVLGRFLVQYAHDCPTRNLVKVIGQRHQCRCLCLLFLPTHLQEFVKAQL